MASNWREQGGNRRLVYGVLLVVTLVGAVVRVSYLDAPMRWDEARLAGWVESWRYARVVSDYNHVGNHILHTLVVAATHALFGAAPWSVRLPSLLTGIALIPATFLTASTLFSRWIALLAAGLVAGSPYLTFYSINARGYSLQCLLVVILPGLLVRLVEAPARWSTVVAGMVGALALYALPTAVFVLPGLSGNHIVGSLGSGFAGVPGRDSDNGSRTTCHRWSYLHLLSSRGLRDRTRSPHDRPLHRSTASRRGLAKIRPTSRRHACSLDLGFAVQRPSAFWCGSGCWRSQSATALRVLRIGRAADTYDGPGCVTRPAAGSPGARLLVPHAILPHTAYC